MFKQFVKGIQGVDSYLIFSMVLFIVFFVVVTIYLFAMKKEDVDTLKNLPLSEDSNLNKNLKS
jgi:cbb3-type cytochrome oxidase subunit 3